MESSLGRGGKRFHILALKWQKLENSTAAASRTWFTTIIIGSTASSQVIVMHDANWRRATGKAEAALEAKAEVKLGAGRGKRELGYFCHFHKQQQRQQAGKEVAKEMERGVAEREASRGNKKNIKDSRKP